MSSPTERLSALEAFRASRRSQGLPERLSSESLVASARLIRSSIAALSDSGVELLPAAEAVERSSRAS